MKKNPSESVNGQIILVRHGQPTLNRKDGPRLNWHQYRQWWSRYEQASLVADQPVPNDLITTARNAPFLFSSPRPRALETAKALAADREIRSDWLFIEAAMPPPHLPRLIRFSPSIWNVLARVSWLFGYAGGEETRRQAYTRAEATAEILDMATRSGSDVILVAHGWFNRMLWVPLLERGWRCTYKKEGNKYWSYQIYCPRRRLRRLRKKSDVTTSDTKACSDDQSPRSDQRQEL